MLAAYIDGNATEQESSIIESSLNEEISLDETLDIVRDSISFSGFEDLDIHKGDFGFGELGLPPIITEDDIINFQNNNSMAKNKTYGYESNYELDTFDPNIWQGN